MSIVVIEKDELNQLIKDAVKIAVTAAFIEHSKAPSDQLPLNDQLLDAREVAELLQISVSSVRNHKRNGILPFRRVGALIKFEKARVLEAFKEYMDRGSL